MADSYNGNTEIFQNVGDTNVFKVGFKSLFTTINTIAVFEHHLGANELWEIDYIGTVVKIQKFLMGSVKN